MGTNDNINKAERDKPKGETVTNNEKYLLKK